MEEGQDSQRDIDHQVNEWIKAHQKTWDGWLAAARAAAQ